MYQFNPPLRILIIEWLCRGVILFMLILQVISVVVFYTLQIILSLVLLPINIKIKGGYDKQLSGMLYGFNVTFTRTSIRWILPLMGMIFSIGYVTFWITPYAPLNFRYGFAVLLSAFYCGYLAVLCLESQTKAVKAGKREIYLPPFKKLLNSPQLFFLNTFSLPRKKQDLPVLSYTEWLACLGEPPEKVTARFIKLGLVTPTPLPIILKNTVTVDTLKEILGKQGVTTEGNKDELILRLIMNNPAKAKKLCPYELFQCTLIGASLANGYLANLRNLQDSEINQMPRILRLERNKFHDLIVWILAAMAGGIIGNRADDLFVQSVHNIIDNLYQKKVNIPNQTSENQVSDKSTQSSNRPKADDEDDKQNIPQIPPSHKLNTPLRIQVHLPTESHILDNIRIEHHILFSILDTLSSGSESLPEFVDDLFNLESLDNLIPTQIEKSFDEIANHLSPLALFDGHQLDHLSHGTHHVEHHNDVEL